MSFKMGHLSGVEKRRKESGRQREQAVVYTRPHVLLQQLNGVFRIGQTRLRLDELPRHYSPVHLNTGSATGHFHTVERGFCSS